MQKRDAIWQAAAHAYKIEAESIAASFERLDPAAFENAVGALARAPRIAASGCGHSGIACRHFAHLMCCVERPARFLSPAEAVHGATGFVQPGDVVLLASRGGETSELLPIQCICTERGATVITVTENPNSELARKADIVLLIRVLEETDRFNSQGTTSFAVMNALFDALQAAVIEETGFQLNHFAHIHPGGAVGRRLNAKAEGEHKE